MKVWRLKPRNCLTLNQVRDLENQEQVAGTFLRIQQRGALEKLKFSEEREKTLM